MSNHFEYLLKEASETPAVSADRLMLMAKTASSRYLRESVPMNETIQKLAQDNDLNKHQVERVCEMANIATHQAMWPAAREKEKVAFDLANPKVITIARGSSDSSPCGGGSSSADYMSPPDLPSQGPSMMELFGADPEEGHNGLHDDGPKKRMIIILQKKAAEAKRLQAELLVEGMRYETQKQAACNAIRQEVLSGTSLNDIQDAAYAIGLGKVASEILPEVHGRLIKETHGRIRTHLEKVAIAPAPEEYISSDLGNTTIINGAHPILISLDILNKQDGRIKNLFTGLARVNDEIKVYNQTIREL